MNAPYVPPAKPGELWNRSYDRTWWDCRPNTKPSQAALNRAYDKLLEAAGDAKPEVKA